MQLDEIAQEPKVARYGLRSRLGVGGLGVVYEAYDPELSRRVAVKLIRHVETSDRGFSRLRREAAALARVNHPNVVAVFDVGRYDAASSDAWPADVPLAGVYIVMELVRGIDLHRWLQTRRSTDEVLRVFAAAGRGLAAAHAAGVVHRDFKPANVILDDDGAVKVLDFGLARWLQGGARGEQETIGDIGEPAHESDPAMTATGVVMGTPAYMAPEQHRGLEVDARTDQYAFCVALAEALCGTRPFRGETVADLASAKESLRFDTRMGTIAPALRTVIERGLARDPTHRFASMDALLVALLGRPRRSWLWLGMALVAGIGTAGLFAVPAPERVAAPSPDESSPDDGPRAPSPAAQALRERAELAYIAGDEAEVEAIVAELTDGLQLPEDDPSLAAEAMLWRGRTASDERSADLVRQAYFLAQEAKAPAIAARAAISMSMVVAGDHGGALAEWTRHAWIAVEQGPWDRGAAIDVSVTAAYALAIAIPSDETIEALEVASAIAADVHPDDGPYVAFKLVHLASGWRYVDRPELALAWAERAKALIEATGDLDHAVLASAENEIGQSLHRLGRCDEALAHLEIARAGYLKKHDGKVELAAALVGAVIADCLRELGRLEAALDEHTRTLAYFDTMQAEYAAPQLKAYLAIARIHAELGRKKEAEAAYTRAIEVVNPLAPDHPLRKKARAELAALRDGASAKRP